MTSPAAPNDPFALAREVGRSLMGVFGAPAQILASAALERKAYLALRRWVALLEMLVRHLLVGVAQGLSLAPPKPPRARRRKTARAVIAPPSPDAPSETWRGVRFRLAPSRTRAKRRRRACATREQRRFFLVKTLALRLEAAIRVIHAPEPYARRLAKRLAHAPALATRLRDARLPRGDALNAYFESLNAPAPASADTS